jgi:hypothetical protein
MSFNLHTYFKKQYLTESTIGDDNTWINLTDSEKEEFADEIFYLIDNAYSDIGGNPNYKSQSDVTGKEKGASYMVIDIDGDGDLDAVKVTKDRPGGVKSAAMGHDGSKSARSAVVNITAIMLKEPGHYIEVSGVLKTILKAKGVPLVTDFDVIKKLLKGKHIEMNDDGTYQRYIGGEKHTKTLMGNPM